MIYNLIHDIEKQKARERLEWLISKEKRIDLTELRKTRSLPQNAYLHLLLSYFALEVGETMQFIKQDMFKRKVNPDIFKFERINPKSGKKRIEWKSTADLDTKQMTDAIDRFKNWSLKNTGIRLPEANEQQFLDHIQNEIDQNKQWL
jgi:hypothetical protein